MQADLKDTEWDCCIVGNGVVALWISHYLWTQKKTVLWITETEPVNASKAFVTRGWWWGALAAASDSVRENLTGFEAGPIRPLDLIYFESKTQKRFRRIEECKPDWGRHEVEVFSGFFTGLKEGMLIDLWDWQTRLASFHETPGAAGPLASFELFKEPRFVRVQGWPIFEIAAKDGRISSLTLAGKKPQTIHAKEFYIGDLEEHLPSLLKSDTATDQAVFGQALKSKPTAPGFGLSLRHKADFDPQTIDQAMVIPLLANPTEKGSNSHVLGRFVRRADGILESYWIGLLTDEEVEDNNEILKKIKHAKRAMDRAIAGFAESIEREAVTFEPRMMTREPAKRRVTEQPSVLGARLFSDRDGLNAALRWFAASAASLTSEGKKDHEQSESEASSFPPLR